MQEKILELENQNIKSKFSHQNAAVDIGQTLTKIVYYDQDELKMRMFPTDPELKKLINFFEQNKDRFKELKFTGGKAYNIYKEYSNTFKTVLINEFDANLKGIEFLYDLIKKKPFKPSLIVTLGTGTSILLYRQKAIHLGGSAMGGAFFMGLVNIFSEGINFDDAVNLASKGNRYTFDLKVSDIYSAEDDRINNLFREYTAASLGKIYGPKSIKSMNKADFFNSIICLIGENIGAIATLYAEIHNVQEIIFSGGFLIKNEVLEKILKMICRFNKKKAIVLENSQFSGAIGALLS
ncbi:MAG: hypothetical protein ACFFC1_08250 [Promethearchaeota archaeon]